MIGPMAESPAAVTPYDAGESVFDATANRGVIASGVREAPGWGGENGAKSAFIGRNVSFLRFETDAAGSIGARGRFRWLVQRCPKSRQFERIASFQAMRWRHSDTSSRCLLFLTASGRTATHTLG